jgi:hypothetical protein
MDQLLGIRRGVVFGDGDVSFMGDDAQARTISLERLLGLGLAHQGLVYPQRHLLHRWALAYARDRMTNYQEVVRHLPNDEAVALQSAVASWAQFHWPGLEIGA